MIVSDTVRTGRIQYNNGGIVDQKQMTPNGSIRKFDDSITVWVKKELIKDIERVHLYKDFLRGDLTYLIEVKYRCGKIIQVIIDKNLNLINEAYIKLDLLAINISELDFNFKEKHFNIQAKGKTKSVHQLVTKLNIPKPKETIAFPAYNKPYRKDVISYGSREDNIRAAIKKKYGEIITKGS